jgi:nitrogen regulatory protein PII
MAFLVMYVLDSVAQMAEVLDVWEKAGATGITIFDTTGIGRLRQAGFRDDLPLLPSLSDLLSQPDINHKTLMTVLDDETAVDRVVEATRSIVGDFSEHHSGILCVLPVLRVYGIKKSASEPPDR